MRKRVEPTYITVSDIHLSHRPPLVRTAEPDWYAAMERQLLELTMLSRELNVPILCAGDVFHKYNPPPELLHFCMIRLPELIAIPGQHDLPHHVYGDMNRTAYGVMKMAGRIHDIHPDHPYAGHIYGFPWGTEFTACPDEKHGNVQRIALVHQYVWKKGKGYAGASKDALIGKYKDICKTYDVVIFGDNHKGFKTGNVVNNGTFMRRNADEIDCEPQVSIIYSDNTVETHKLQSVREDKFIDIDAGVALVERALDMTDFVHELNTLGGDAMDFVEAIKRFCDGEGISDQVRSAIMEAAGQ